MEASNASSSEDCCVKVAVHIRPLIGDEKLQGCKDCVTVVPGKPQVQLGTHSFTFDHVYGSTGSLSAAMFKECVAPLVEGLFQGYNATVLAYGQQQIEFQLQVSFIEIHKEEVRDLLDSNAINRSEPMNGQSNKITVPGKPPVQIREASNGVITLAGTTECSVKTLKEMADCLEQGSLNRATGSTNMNNQSSRSHAIFTITVEQMRKLNPVISKDANENDNISEEYLCAKLHLVDLAGSERAKRTGSDGLRFKEGVHINKGLLALGNVISALGDDKKRKEGNHVPYRDSKLTRLLQDSLGGNSKTVMIACISPADINAEETLNTLKYANRARNIQNKPVINRNPISNEMLKMRQQLEYLQAELCGRGGGASSDEILILKDRIAQLEATNEKLCQELHGYRSRCGVVEICETDTKVGNNFSLKGEGLKRGLQSVESCDYQSSDNGESMDIDEEAEKEWEHNLLQDSMDKQLHELNRRLEQKESEMKLFGTDPITLKQHFGKKLIELEEEKRTVQQERDRLLTEIENLAANSDEQAQKAQDVHTLKLKTLESQIQDLKKKQENQVQLLKQKQKSDEAAKKLQEEIQYIKAQKVQLQQKIKQEAEHFRQWKASREKELLQLKLKGVVKHVNNQQRDNSVSSNGNGINGQNNEKSLQRWLDHELEVMVNVHEVRYEYEKQIQVRAALAEELAVLRQVDEFASKGSSPRGKNGYSRASSIPPNSRMARIASLENMVGLSSNSLVSMASQLSEAEERERAFMNRGRWSQLRSMGDAKSLLQYMYNSLGDARCQLWDKELEIKEMDDQLKELVNVLRQSEIKRKAAEKELKMREQALAKDECLTITIEQEKSNNQLTYNINGPPSPIPMPAQKQLKYTAGIASGSVKESAAFIDQTRKMVSIMQLPAKKLAFVGQGGKLWRWKRSHHQWLLQFKWRWQKPWKLSEWIRHSDETIMRARPRPLAIPDAMYRNGH
ncbi:hypothetical protein Leryth_003697 [Lithospermum erythrorhizon]|nr:hypothetical protein Leryth_003697 [Lithospermum erythrorhizon]